MEICKIRKPGNGNASLQEEGWVRFPAWGLSAWSLKFLSVKVGVLTERKRSLDF